MSKSCQKFVKSCQKVVKKNGTSNYYDECSASVD
jgi:hypothetical protein